jgi:Cof subfamily protein (haloacid dehalogenase superfamily)
MSGLGNVRMLATDLDGTLLRPDGSVSARTIAALAAARDAGFTVVFVTGRPPRWLAEVVDATGHAGTAVCANGGLLVDLDADKVLTAHAISPELVLELADELRSAAPELLMAVEFVPIDSLSDHASFGLESGYASRLGNPPGARIAPLSELVAGQPVVKLLARGSQEHTPDSLLAIAQRVVAGRAEVTHSSPRDPLLEISAVGVSKASTLASYAASLGLGPAEVVTVGDMPNDVPMLQWADRSYAIEGSHPHAMTAAAGRAGRADHDGVAVLLESLLADLSGTSDAV